MRIIGITVGVPGDYKWLSLQGLRKGLPGFPALNGLSCSPCNPWVVSKSLRSKTKMEPGSA